MYIALALLSLVVVMMVIVWVRLIEANERDNQKRWDEI